MLRAGGLSVRDLKRTAAALDVTEPLAAFWVELAYAAGLLASDGEADERYAADPGRTTSGCSCPPASAGRALAAAWLAATRTPGLVGGRDAKGRALSALGPRPRPLRRPRGPPPRPRPPRRAAAGRRPVPGSRCSPGCAGSARCAARRGPAPTCGPARRADAVEAELLGGRRAAARCRRPPLARSPNGPLTEAELLGVDRPRRARRPRPRADRRHVAPAAAPPRRTPPPPPPAPPPARPAPPRAPRPRPAPGRPDRRRARPAAAPARRRARRPRRHRVQGRRDGLPLHARLRTPRPGRRPLRRRPARLPRRALPHPGPAAARLPHRRRGPQARPSAGRRGLRLRPLRRRRAARRDPRRPPRRRACGCAASPRPCWPPRPPRTQLLDGLRAMGYAPAAESAEGDVLITRADAHRTPPRTAARPGPRRPAGPRRHPARRGGTRHPRRRPRRHRAPQAGPRPPAPAAGAAAPHHLRRDPRHHAGRGPHRLRRCGSATSTPTAPPASASSPRSGSRAASSRRTTTPPTRSARTRCTGSRASRNWRTTRSERASAPAVLPSRAGARRPSLTAAAAMRHTGRLAVSAVDVCGRDQRSRSVAGRSGRRPGSERRGA